MAQEKLRLWSVTFFDQGVNTVTCHAHDIVDAASVVSKRGGIRVSLVTSIREVAIPESASGLQQIID